MKAAIKIFLFVCAMIYLLLKDNFNVSDLIVIILLIFFVGLVSWVDEKIKRKQP